MKITSSPSYKPGPAIIDPAIKHLHYGAYSFPLPVEMVDYIISLEEQQAWLGELKEDTLAAELYRFTTNYDETRPVHDFIAELTEIISAHYGRTRNQVAAT